MSEEIQSTITEHTDALWSVFLDWLTQPEVFFPLLLIHVITFLVVQLSKHLVTQWLPLMIANAVIYYFNKTRDTGIPFMRRVCSRTRKSMTALLALVVAWKMSSLLLPMSVMPEWYDSPRWVADMTNGLLNPALVWLMFQALPLLGERGQKLADWLGARDADFYEERAESVMHEDSASDRTSFIVKSALGIGKRPAPRKDEEDSNDVG